jgi:DNA-binding NarL/FixJ family response regulator
MRILLADDEPMVCSALRLLLEQEPDVEVVGEVGEAGALAEWLSRGCADLCIVDWELPGLPIGDRQKLVRALCCNLKLVAISGRSETRVQALAAGVDGFISKTEPPEHVLALVRALIP